MLRGVLRYVQLFGSGSIFQLKRTSHAFLCGRKVCRDRGSDFAAGSPLDTSGERNDKSDTLKGIVIVTECGVKDAALVVIKNHEDGFVAIRGSLGCRIFAGGENGHVLRGATEFGVAFILGGQPVFWHALGDWVIGNAHGDGDFMLGAMGACFSG